MPIAKKINSKNSKSSKSSENPKSSSKKTKKKLLCIFIGGWGFSKKCLHDCLPLFFLKKKFDVSCQSIHWAKLLNLSDDEKVHYFNNLIKNKNYLVMSWSIGSFLMLELLQKMSAKQQEKMIALFLLSPATSFVKNEDNLENTPAKSLKIMRLHYAEKSTRSMVWQNFYTKCYHPVKIKKTQPSTADDLKMPQPKMSRAIPRAIPRPVGTVKQLLAGLDYLEKFQMAETNSPSSAELSAKNSSSSAELRAELWVEKTLVLYGENDIIIPQSAAQFFAKKLQLKKKKIENSGHAFPLTHLRTVKKEIATFLKMRKG